MSKAMQQHFEELLLEAIRRQCWADEITFRWIPGDRQSSGMFAGGWTLVKRGSCHNAHTGHIRNGLDLLSRRKAKCHYGDSFRLQEKARAFLDDPESVDSLHALADCALQAGLFGEIRYGNHQY